MAIKERKLSTQITLANEAFERADYDQARAICLKVMKKTPNCPEILYCLGLIYFKANDFAASAALIERAIQQNHNIHWQLNLANAYLKKGELNKAERMLRKILKKECDFAEAYQLLGEINFHRGDLARAEENYLQAITFEPNLVVAYLGLGLILARQGFVEASIAAFRHLLKFKFNDEASAHALHSLAASHLLQGNVTETLECLAEALEKKPDFHQAHSAFLATLNYLLGFEGDKVFAHYLKFNLNHALMIDDRVTNHDNSIDFHRKLKIGYVSPDFRNHALFNFIEPVFRNFDRQVFSIYCYYSHTEKDSDTERLKQSVGHWIDCTQLSDAGLAQRIIEDEIDILVDLAGHTVGNRLMTFARKPAPVQITFAGYPYSTGLTAMDYRITDPLLDPPGMTENIHSEKLLYLPSTAFFSPPEITPEVNALPALNGEFFTLASFNQIYKVTDQVIELWSAILNRIGNSRLFMLLGDAENEVIQEKYREKFVAFGVRPDQLVFFGKQSIDQYLQRHHLIDLALDTFPFNGGTTTHYSLWMGVPVITLAGNTPCSRVGVTILSAVGLEQCITGSAEAYVTQCEYFAEHTNELAGLRRSLRETMTHSCIRDEKGFVRTLDTAYRQVWQQWCKRHHDMGNTVDD